jgi:hypothetical protein
LKNAEEKILSGFLAGFLNGVRHSHGQQIP